MTDLSEPRGVGGWLLILTRWLVVGQPLVLTVTVTGALGALSIRGLPLAALIGARVLVAALGLAAGIALTRLRPGAVTLAAAALFLAAVTDVVTLTTSIWPNNRPPGDTPRYVAATLVYHAGWLAYLWRSKRVRNTLP
jgi:hypothetical protein